jgi:hypothetical protein
MKKARFFSARSLAGALITIVGIGLGLIATVPATSVPETFNGTYDPTVYPCATPRHHFTVPANQVRIVVQVSATVPTNDLTLSLLYGPDPNPILIHTEDTATSSEVYAYQPAGGLAPGEYQVQICQTPTTNGVPQMAPFTYNGTFTYDDTGGAGGSPPPPFGAIPPATQASGPKVGFENFPAPGVLVQVKTTEAGQQPNSVEYMGRNAGEPSIGNNWLTDTTVYYSGLETLFVKFDDSCPVSGLSSTWVNKAAPTQIAVDSDPIGFTDSTLGRSFAGELTLLSPSCKTSYTTDDGATWVLTQGSGLASGVDHETIGGGVYHAPLDLNPPSLVYPHAVYYCSQEGVPASGPPSFCSRSDDGGLTFGASVPLTTPPVNVCGGLHGHVKVGPDGTAYVPFNTCGGVGSLLVSEDNGGTWTIRHVQTATVAMQPSASFQDPALAIDAAGRIYYIIANNDTAAAVLTSDDHGATWQNLGDVAAVYGLKNIRYPAAIAGDGNPGHTVGRAAVAFYGTTTPGDALQGSFNGVWHLYIASTFDGGVTWNTVDATPNAPMQRGCIWAKGGANICRNLLDFFDMTVDKDGRVLVGYVNGCEGGNCVQAPLTAQGETPPGQGNAYGNTATIARQSSGRRLFASKDPAPTSKPGMPWLTQRRIGNGVFLQWSEADTGNLTITKYQILRGTSPNTETLLAEQIPASSQTGGTYTDTLATNDTQTYYYKVLAVNSAGASCGNNEVAAPYVGDPCTGIVIHRNDPTHPEANTQTATPASLLIDYVSVAEPPDVPGAFKFTMKVNDLSTLPPNSRWRIAWDSFAAETYPAVPNPDPTGDPLVAQQFYVGMTTGASGGPTFEYGTLADAGVPAVFVIGETTRASCTAAATSCAIPASGKASRYTTDGTITIYVPKTAFGPQTPTPTAPAVGTLLGGVNGRTLTGDTPGSPESKLERSNTFIDHTFVKAQTDQAFPAATYTVTGNNLCSSTAVAPIGAVSRKVHGSAGTFDIDLPLTGPPGIECRSGGTNGSHTVVIAFPTHVTVSGPATCAGQPATKSSIGNSVTVNCTNVPNAQVVNVTLQGVTDGTNTANVSIPMAVLGGDTTADRSVNSADISQTKSQSGKTVTSANFREDVTFDGSLNSADISFVKSKSGTALP